MGKTDVFDNEDFRRVLGALYCYMHSDNPIAAYCFNQVRAAQGNKYLTDKQLLLRLMRNIEELYAWWEPIRAELNIPTHAEVEATELQEMYEAYYGTSGS